MEGGAGRKKGRKEQQLRKSEDETKEQAMKVQQGRKGDQGMEEAIPKAVEHYCMTRVHTCIVLC
jgi:hypothetical protein